MTRITYYPPTSKCAANNETCERCGAKPGEACSFHDTKVVAITKDIVVKLAKGDTDEQD